MNNSSIPGLFLLLALLPARCFSDEAATKGQEIFEKNKRGVVTVEVVLKASYSKDGKSSPASSRKYDLTGTVLDPSGLTVLAYSACDAAEFYKRVMPGYSGYKVESEITDVKILLEDNTEVPAEIVLRDKDLDLAFVRPKAPLAHRASAINFGRSASAHVLEQVITLNRLNEVSGRSYSACVQRILAVKPKPRPFYLFDGGSAGAALGCPVFALNGEVIGLMVMKIGGAMGDDYRENAASIIIPAAEVAKTASQVPPPPTHTEEKNPPAKKDTHE